MLLQDKIAVVTGGGRGIGRGISKRFAHEGACVVLAQLDPESGEHTRREIEEAGGRALFVQTDVAQREQVDRLIARTLEHFGGLDIMINNAGITLGGGLVSDTPIEDWERVMDVNLNSVFYLSRAALPQMRRQQSGQIVNISSNAVNTLPGGSAAYATSKAGVVALTKVLSKEEARNGIRVNCICPGMIAVGMGMGALARRGPELAQQFLNTIPLGRAGSAEEVAPTVVFLCSDEASYITGQNFNVNGGDRTESYQ